MFGRYRYWIMKLRTIIKTALTTSIILLCVGIVVSLYFKMRVVECAEDFDLYTLVPFDSQAVLATDNTIDLIQYIDNLDYSKDGHLLPFSRLFSFLKTYIPALLTNSPHGLSRQMNRMLISFHEPDNADNQVFYCRLDLDDGDFVQEFIQKHCAADFPFRSVDYRGEKICIYPLSDGTFFACYLTSEFLVLSYQKRLIEHVIDARLDKNCILTDDAFSEIHSDKQMLVPATLYLRTQSVNMGKGDVATCYYAALGNWTKFSVSFNEGAVYLSGIGNEVDSCATFVNAVCKQAPTGNFSGDLLPASTFCFSKVSISDLQHFLHFSSKQGNIAPLDDCIVEGNKILLDFLNDHADSVMTACLFQNEDTLSINPHAILSIPMLHTSGVERLLGNLCKAVSCHTHTNPLSPTKVHFSTSESAYVFYLMPDNTLFAQLTGTTDLSLSSYACLYRGQFLISSDVSALKAYIYALENVRVLEGTPSYEKVIATLSRPYNFTMMADLSVVLEQPEKYVCFVPNFFFRNRNFFSRFLFVTQIICIDGVPYPTIEFLYKEKNTQSTLF